MTTRRGFLRHATAAAALGLPDLTSFRTVVAGAVQDPPAVDRIQFSPDLEPIVRLIEESPREKCVAALAEQLRRGLTYRQFMSAIFMAAVRKQNSHHSVYLVHSAHQISLDLRSEERLLPLFWAVDHYKWQQGDFPTPPLAPLKGDVPSGEKAAAEFDDAMQRLEVDRAERAVVGLARGLGPRQAMERLWPHGCRDLGFIGHKAISLSSCWRVMETIGWRHAEPVLRFVVRDVVGQDQYYPANVERVDRHLGGLPAGWRTGDASPEVTLELVGLMRQGKSVDACDLACKHLGGGAGAQSIWDAVHVGAAELLIAYGSSSGMAGRPLHLNTAANALHHAYCVALSDRTRLLVLLQAVAWVSDFIRVQLGAKNLEQSRLVDLEGVRPEASGEEAVAEIFSVLPAHTYDFDSRTKKGAGHNVGDLAKRGEGTRKVFALMTEHPEAAPLYMRAARSWLVVKATMEAHEYKLPAALFEEFERVSPRWRPRLLAASARWIHGKNSRDSALLQKAREALR
jgi:hypothetical protein